MARPIENHKTVCRELAPEGWAYVGYDEPFYLFQKGNYADGFFCMQCLAEDLTKENLALMAKLGVTR